MRTKIRVNPKTGVFYVPKDLLEDGFKGEMDAFVNAVTFAVIHPKADLNDIKQSLRIMLKDIDLRLKTKAGSD